jgi:hypothetical protein
MKTADLAFLIAMWAFPLDVYNGMGDITMSTKGWLIQRLKA